MLGENKPRSELLEEIQKDELSLPEFDGSAEDLDILRRERNFLDWFWADPDLTSAEFNAVLPQVVGYVPEEERERFTEGSFVDENGNILHASMMNTHSLGDLSAMSTFFPGIHSIITEDLRSTEMDPDGATSKLLKGIVKKDKAQFEPRIHADGGTDAKRGTRRKQVHLYVVTNDDPTEMYEGPAVIYKHRWGNDREDLNVTVLKDARSRMVKAKPFQIVRMTNLTMHRSPTAVEDVSRGLLRVWCEQWRKLPIAA